MPRPDLPIGSLAVDSKTATPPRSPSEPPKSGRLLDSLGLILREHDDGGMNIKGLGELLDAPFADPHPAIFQQA